MCGIIGYIGFQNPKDILLDALKRLEYRGYDSSGIAIMQNGQAEICRSTGRILNLEEKLSTAQFTGTVGIGHTRWATHGAPSERNAHPHRVGSITLVHNGIIENYLQLKKELLAEGAPIASDTDSEIVAHLLWRSVRTGKTLEQALATVLPRLRGAYALVILNDREPDTVVSVRNGAPLLVGLGTREVFVASDVQAVLHRTNRFIYLADQQLVSCTRDGIRILDALGREVTPEVKEVSWTPEQLEKAGYQHYMLKEIHEQPTAMAKTIAASVTPGAELLSLKALELNPGFLEGVRRISIVACGSARHAGLIGKYYLERFTNLPVEVDFGSEFRYRRPVLDQETLLILVSQSGETADTLAALREGKKRGVRTLAICNVRDSTLTREADATLYTNAGPEIGVASTKAFTTQLVVLYALAVELGHRNGQLNREAAEELTHELMGIPFLVERVLAMEPEIERIARALQGCSFFFFLGRDAIYPVALEGALKLKEVSYVHAEGVPAGEIKHGPIALVDANTAVIIMAPQDRPNQFDEGGVLRELSETVNEKLMSNLQEAKSRGGRIVTFGSSDERFVSQSHYHVALPDGPWAANPILLSIPVQLLAYYVGVQRGTDVDKPRNLAKSVTVE